MKRSDIRVSEIITVPRYRFLKGTELLANGGRSNSKPTGNGVVSGTTSQYNEEVDHSLKFGRAYSCGNDVRIHKMFAHTSGVSDVLLQVNKEEIKDLIVDLLRSHLGSQHYDHKRCSQQCLKLGEIIEANVRQKCLGCKIVSTILIGALRDKGPAIASQSLYSERSDCIALAYYSNQSLFASAAVFVVRL